MLFFFGSHNAFGYAGYTERIVGCLDVCLRVEYGWRFDVDIRQTQCIFIQYEGFASFSFLESHTINRLNNRQ